MLQSVSLLLEGLALGLLELTEAVPASCHLCLLVSQRQNTRIAMDEQQASARLVKSSLCDDTHAQVTGGVEHRSARSKSMS